MQNKSEKLSPLTPLNKGGTGRYSKVPLIKGDIGGFDKDILKAKGLITTGFHLPYNPNMIEIAHLLINNLTPAEKKIWYSYFCSCEFRVLKQRPIDNYIVDFYLPKFRLVVEIDGDTHFVEDGKTYEQERTAILERYGLKVAGFQNSDVLNNIEGVVNKIEQMIDVTEHAKMNADGT